MLCMECYGFLWASTLKKAIPQVDNPGILFRVDNPGIAKSIPEPRGSRPGFAKSIPDLTSNILPSRGEVAWGYADGRCATMPTPDDDDEPFAMRR